MKLFTQWRFILLSALFSLIGVGSVWAQLTSLEVGGVYHFTNVSYTTKAMAATTPSSTAGLTADNTNKAQLWYVADKQVKEEVTYYALRNLGYGTYLQGNGQSSAWTLANTTDSDKSWFALTLANGNTAIRSYNERSNNHGFAHIDGSSNVVGWSNDASATQWTVEKVAMSDDDIQTALGIFDNVASYQTTLNALFTDKACTTLNGSVDESSASFQALPTTLQNMVRKVAGGDAAWEEANKDNTKDSWGADYAKKYRVQLYEPYNDAGAAASALGLNAHNSLNNPTGIFANNGDVLYVMVDGEIKEGASLYLAYYTGHGKLDASSKVGYELKQGLNVIPVYQNSSNFCVNYVVQTFDTSKGKGNKAKARKLSDYAPIKIHIEGGYINGYYNKVGDTLYPADKNANWDYIEARATQKTVTVLGKYITLQFPLKDDDTYDGDNNKNKGLASIFNDMVEVEKSIDEWDNVMLWERLLLGVLGESTIQAEAKTSPYAIDKTKKVFEYTGGDGEFESDYSDYYNIHGLSLGTPTGYMYGGWDHCGYHYNTMQSILVNMTTESGPHWGPGHEIGHQHQALLTVNGLTEVTNNLFSNVVLWYFGESTSRYNGTEGALSSVLAQFNAEGTDFFSNNIWAQTIMYYKLFLYYHVLGHNPKFYPHLFEMLRQDPMSTGYEQDGSKCLMHFYKKCCLAAGEDLTEFFRAHGFFEVMDNRLVGDYSNSVYTLTQEQINTAIKEVKDLGYKENISVLFITDATSDEITSHKGGTLTPFGSVCGEFGSYSTFNNNTEASYTYNISGTTVTMDGSGGVGFAILNENGELIGFSDKKTFELSPEAAEAIVSGKASIVTINANNSTPVVATNIMDTGDDDTRHQLLGNLLDEAKAALDCTDDSGTKVGFYRASALTELQKAYDTAKGVYDAKTASAYSAVYDVLFQEYTNLINNAYARINIIDGAAYRLTNKAYTTLNMGVATSGDDENEMFGLTADESSDAQIWYFEPSTTAGSYYLKNKATSLYPAGASSGSVLKADKDASGAAAYRLEELETGVFALINGPALHCSSSQSNNIVGWNKDGDASRWYLTAVQVDNALEARLKLEETIDKTAALVDEMADALPIQNFKLQTEDQTAAFYLSTNACHNTLNNASDGQGLSGLLDDDTSTYFHSDYHGKVSDTHYLQVDLGANHNVAQFIFNYTTRSNGKNCPTAILVEGSNDSETFYELKTFTATNDGLPDGNALSWESPTIDNSNKYRVIRFSVTATENSQKYFVMSTFGITNPTPIVNTIKDDFVGDDASNEALKTQIVNALTELAEAQQLVDGASATEVEYNQQNADLTTHYNNLLTVYNTAKNADFNAKKTELLTLIGQANTLITECGSVNCTPATSNEAQLQTTTPTGNFYLWTNAQSTQEGPIADLIDGNNQTYFHSDYSGTNSTDGFDHHLTVNLVGETTSKFKFSYITRHDAETNYPKTIKVYGSTDGTNYEEVTTITGLTAQNTWTYNSEVITASKEFSNLRFMVTATNNNNLKGGHPIFHMAEFDLTIEKSAIYTAELNDNVGGVTTDLLIATYKEAAEAQSTYELATTEQQVVKAIAQLQAQYSDLLDAKNNQYAQALRDKIDETTTLITACADIVDGSIVTVKDEAGDATKTLILATYNKAAEAQALLDAGGATQSQYEEATAALEAQRAALQVATEKTTKAALRLKVADLEALINECGSIVDGVVVEIYDATNSVTNEMLLAAYQAKEDAKTALEASELSDYSTLTAGLETHLTTLATAKATKRCITDLANLSNAEIYGVNCKRGPIAYLEAQSTTRLGTPTKGAANELNDSNPQENETEQFAILRTANTPAGKYYLYSLSKGAFVGTEANFTATPAAVIEFKTSNFAAGYPWEVWIDGKKLNVNTTSGVVLPNSSTPDNGNCYRIQIVGEDANKTADAVTAIEAYEALLAAKTTATEFLNSTPETAGYPVEAERTNLQEAIDAATDIASIDAAMLAFKTSSNINMPEDGKAYKIKAWWKNEERYMTFVETEDANIFAGSEPAYVPVSDASKAVTFVCRKTGDDTYAFVSNNGYYLGWQADGKKNNTSKSFAVNGHDNTLKIQKGVVNNNGTILELVDLFGTLNILGKNASDAGRYYHFMFNKTSKNYHSGGSGDMYYFDDRHTVYYTFEEVPNYTNSVKMNTLQESDMQLLNGLTPGISLSTFSAPYATITPEGVTAYYAESITEGTSTVALLKKVRTAIPAGEGVVLLSEEEHSEPIKMLPATTEEVPAEFNNRLTGTGAQPVVMGQNGVDYILGRGSKGAGFYKAKAGSTLAAGKAYFHFENAAQVRNFVLRFGGETTDIEDAMLAPATDDGAIYDLSGRRVNEVTKGGIYIKNGKKFIVK